MIDPADQQTQALPLDEKPAKRKRGRPATGKAMTPAEKQRAYRERQKAKSGYVDPATVEEIKRMQAEITSLRDALIATDAAALKKIDELRAENEKLKKQLSSRDDNDLMQRVELAEARADAMGNELAKAKARAAKAGPKMRRYVLQFRYETQEGVHWEDDKTGDYSSKKEAERACKRMNEPGVSETEWRVRERKWI
ncbi:hypothetical protein [Stutzerimonas nitrititolerans]|uniref:hypothetical protein n=1 Tax=Stutzerimonas nitrititolerans TaxID=2482751 RepID=UPI0028A72F90|nr:hypothetical protein [Stutzerimonas nitrititolerans]